VTGPVARANFFADVQMNMLTRLSAALTAVTLCTALARPEAALAWGATGHRMIGGLASQSLPSEIPEFLRTPEAARQIGEVSRELDRSKGAGEPHDADADPAHRVAVGDDLKIARGPSLAALPPNRESYDTALRAVGANEYRAGYLPYAIMDAWQQLVTDLGYWRADIAGAKYANTPAERTWFLKDEYIREGLTIRDLGFLSHLVADGSQPMHVSVHFDGWGEYPNPQKFSERRGLHAKVEGSFVRNTITEKDIAALMTPYRDCRCTLQRRVSEYLIATQREVVALYQIEKSDGFDGRHESGKVFVARGLAAAVSELRDLITDAWRRSAQVSIGFPPIPVPDIESGKTNALSSLQGLD
jgi:hypothetical protein